MQVSVIIPSRLAENPMSERGNLFLTRALQSVGWQVPVHEIILGLSPGASPPELRGVRYEVAAEPGQAAAVNAAAATATGDVLAFLEDDDYWEVGFLRTALGVMGDSGARFVTSNQREVTLDGSFARYNDFPTPSGWVMRRSLWEFVGGMDTTFRYHVDTDFLGRATRMLRDSYQEPARRRVHLVEAGALETKDPRRRAWLASVSRNSLLGQTEAREPLVVRFANPDGGMSRIACDPEAARQSEAEHETMRERYGEIPW